MRNVMQCWLTSMLLVAAASIAIAQPQPPSIAAARAKAASISLETADSTEIDFGFSVVVEAQQRITSVGGFRASVVQVEAFTPKSIRVLSAGVGETSLEIGLEDGLKRQLTVRVTSRAITEMRQLLAKLYPKHAIELYEVSNCLLMRGSVDSPIQLAEIAQIGEQFYPTVLNQLRLAGSSNPATVSGRLPAPGQPKSVPSSGSGSPEAPGISRQPIHTAPTPPTTLKEDIQLLRADVRRLINLLEQRQKKMSSDELKKLRELVGGIPAGGVVPAAASQPKPARPSGPTDEPRLIGVNEDGKPTIDGRSFEEWRRVVEFEPSPKALIPAIQALTSLGRRDKPAELAEALFDTFIRFPFKPDQNEGRPGTEELVLEIAMSFRAIPEQPGLEFVAERLRSSSSRDVENALLFYSYSLAYVGESENGFELPVVIQHAMIDAWLTKPDFKHRNNIAALLFQVDVSTRENDQDKKYLGWLWKFREHSIEHGWESRWNQTAVMTRLFEHDPDRAEIAEDVISQIESDIDNNVLFPDAYRLAARIAAETPERMEKYIPTLLTMFEEVAEGDGLVKHEQLHGRNKQLSQTFSHRLCLVEILGELGASARDAQPVIEEALATIPAENWDVDASDLRMPPQLLVDSKFVDASDKASYGRPEPIAAPSKQPKPIEAKYFVLSALRSLKRISGKAPDIDKLKPAPVPSNADPFGPGQ